MHIGLIGGIGPAATEFYYRGLTDGHAKSGTRLELTIANAEVGDLSQNLANEDARSHPEPNGEPVPEVVNSARCQAFWETESHRAHWTGQ